MSESKPVVHFNERGEFLAFTSGDPIVRCYFMRGGHIEAVEELPGLAQEEAIAKAHALFSERRHSFEGFELWDRTRVLIRCPEPAAANSPGVWPLQKNSRRVAASVRPSTSQSIPLKPPLKA